MAYRMGRGFGNVAPAGRYRLRGFGAALDCNNVNPPADPVYENCAPTDSNCVGRNAQVNAQHNVDWQSYHDEVAACSAKKFAASGGTITPSAFTYGAGTDYFSGNVYTAPVASQADYEAAMQPYQTPAQRAASEAALSAVQNQPLMYSAPPAAPSPAPPSANPTLQQPPQAVVSAAPPPSKSPAPPTSPTIYTGGNGTPQDMTGGPSFSLSSIPWWGWLIAAGAGAWAVSKA